MWATRRPQWIISCNIMHLSGRQAGVVLGVLLVSLALAVNGAYIMFTGKISPLVPKPPRSDTTLSLSSRLVLAVFYLVVAACLVVVIWRVALR